MAGLIRALFQTHLDLTLATGAQFETRIVERPGLWMAPEDLAALTEDLKDIAAKTLARGSLNYGVFSGDPERMKATIVTLVRRKDTGQPVAFNALAIMDIADMPEPTEVLHLGLVMVDPDQQSRGLSWVLYGLTCLLLLFRNQLRPLHISNVTQVPAVVGMVSETFSDVFPTPARPRERALRHLLLARQIMAQHRHVFGVGAEAGFDEDRFVITNAYTGGSDDLKKTFDQAQKHRDDQYNAFCRDALDYERGDDILQIGQIDLVAGTGYLRTQVPKASLAGISLTVVLLMLQRLVLPVLHWFDSSRHFGILRPRKPAP
ncbi:hypothetical protein [Pacificoceanicola onchidii]|uniref:hypothetical protein n=1 Tax=Pacificoceanicola onchidii TaxID=2562685 RepID=UPI0010A2FB04|nr:hypothetical protein [Pacificoceanicola onchidii]